ncbi:MAG: DJ-1/PfpI family protein [Enterococcus sp.]|nr:DJ-1/PfpI family protein [Enterococcus sp.]MDU5336941.1 DJ-1/PfpI family protein [Enterococcus sp.]
MNTIYVYVMDTLADWELGHLTAELNSGRFFKQRAQQVTLKTVSYSKDPITTMGGMTIIPDCAIDEIVVSEANMLLLPGADTWNDPKHGAVIEKASAFLSSGAKVGASVEQLLPLLMLDYWRSGHIRAMDQDFWT